MTGRVRLLFVLGLVSAFAALPVALGDHFFLFVLAGCFIFAMLSLGLQFVVGFSGILSLGHAAFFGIGAYTSAVLTSHAGLPFLLAMVLSGIMAGVGGLLMSPIIRLREVYFAMASFAFGIIMTELFVHWKSVTGGHDGLSTVPFASIGPLVFDSPTKLYYLTLVVAIAQYAFTFAVIRSPIGRALDAMKQNANGAQSAGLNIVALKIYAILLGAVTAGIAGSLYAHITGSVSPQMFRWAQSINLLTMVIVGGSTSIIGVTIATFVIQLMPEYLRGLSAYTSLINGLILALFMMFLPRGIGGLPLRATLRKIYSACSTKQRRSPAELSR